MKISLIIVLSLLSTVVIAKDKYSPTVNSCKKVEKEIERIRSIQKQGHSSRQAEYYRNEKRELRKLENACKKKRIPTK